MMEDTGEDILRQRPSVVTTFFKRIGQVRNNQMYIFKIKIIFNTLKVNVKETPYISLILCYRLTRYGSINGLPILFLAGYLRQH